MIQETQALKLTILFYSTSASVILYLFTGGPLVRYDINKRKFVVFFKSY